MADPADKPAVAQPRVRECSTCTFWDNSVQAKIDTLPIGLCRRNAPRPIEQFGSIQNDPRTGITFASALWPVTLAGENCGEHKFPPPGKAAQA